MSFSRQVELSDRYVRAAQEVTSGLPKTMELYERASAVVPAGFTRARVFWPVPLCIDKGEGAHLWDIDGNRYIDCLMGFGAMLLGHRHPAITAALEDQLINRGTHFGLVVREESELATIVQENVPGAERVFFVNSGTEATLAAVRLARAATGKTRVAKFEGGWHGWHDFLMHSFLNIGGSVTEPVTLPSSLGIPDAATETVITLPYDQDAALDLIRGHRDELACVVVEGLQGAGGSVLGGPEFIKSLRAVCDATGVLLVLDEVITGFRLGAGGAAAHFDVVADLTTLGKAVGGGMPIGGVCGRRDVMDLVLPNKQGEYVITSGTFAGNPMSMVAGKAQLQAIVDRPEEYARLAQMGDRMRRGIQSVLDELSVPGAVTGGGSVWGVHLGPTSPPSSARDVTEFALGPNFALTGYLLRAGVVVEAPVHLCFVSTAHNDELIDEVIDSHRVALQAMMDDGFFQ